MFLGNLGLLPVVGINVVGWPKNVHAVVVHSCNFLRIRKCVGGDLVL